MKKILVGVLLVIAIAAIVMVQNLKNSEVAHDTALTVVVGKFAFCGASGAKPTGKIITVEGKEFFEGVAACPVLDGPSIANTILVPNPTVTPDSTDKTVWSYFWYYDSVPQAPTWKNLPTANRTFTITNTGVTKLNQGPGILLTAGTGEITISSSVSADGFKDTVPKLVLPLKAINFDSYPINETSSVPLLTEESKLKFPSKSVVAPIFELLTITDAPGNG
jgi:hypothetical protein